jgi:SagB-type dehydrogenase family enzyme
VSARLADTLASLARTPRTAGEIAGAILRSGGAPALAEWCFAVDRLHARAGLEYVPRPFQQPIGTLVPVSEWWRPDRTPLIGRRRVSLGRLVFIRPIEDRFRVESPTARAWVETRSPAALAIMPLLGADKSVQAVLRSCRRQRIGASSASTFLALLHAAGLLAQRDDDQATDPDAPWFWPLHDALSHARGRIGHHATARGQRVSRGPLEVSATIRLPLGERIELPPLDFELIEHKAPPLDRVLRLRRSRRRYAGRPITLAQLGQFLGRVDRETRDSARRAKRVYPSGGGRYPLQIFVAAAHCEGLVAGLYRYSRRQHKLLELRASAEGARMLVRSARLACGRSDDGQSLIVVAAEFARTLARYEGVGYSLILKEVGALIQTMYLVATAMELAACAVASGDSELFASLTGTDYFALTSVGELLLGSMAPGDLRPQ